jgi:hypothetical protein
MAKTKISEYSATSASNTDIANINIAEGCSPANVNNAIRTVMAQLKDQQAGTSGDSFTVGGNLTVTGTTTLTTVLPVASGGTGASTNAGTAYALKGANSDITSITGLTTPLTTAQGGTGTASTTFANLATNVTGTLPVANGGTGAATLTSGSVIVGAGTSTPTFVAPTTTGNVLFTTNGTTWSSTAKIVRTTAQSPTSGTTVSFTSIPSWVKRITVLFDGLVASASEALIQIGAGSTTITGYTSTSAQFNNAISGESENSTAGYNMNISLLSPGVTGSMVIYNISGNIWISNHMVFESGRTVLGNGIVTLGGTLDRVIITSTSPAGTFSAGSVNIMYE